MPSRRPAVGELWLAYVEFIDRPGVGKVRPAAVMDVDETTRTVIALKITSRDLQDDPAIPCLPIEDWERRGLVKPSFIRLDQKFELAWERLLREAPLGTLGANDMKAIEDFLSDENAS